MGMTRDEFYEKWSVHSHGPEDRYAFMCDLKETIATHGGNTEHPMEGSQKSKEVEIKERVKLDEVLEDGLKSPVTPPSRKKAKKD